jgi:hypothetical protein
MKKSYSVIIATAVLAGGLVLGGSTLAKAEHVMKSGGDLVQVKMYGQVNRAFMHADNGNEDQLFHVDNDNSSTRIGLKGKAKVSDTLSTGINFEAEWQKNASNKVRFDNVGGDDDGFTLRKFELFLDSKNLGKLSMGQGDTASNGTSEIDLSGTSVAGYSDTNTWGGDIVFYDNIGMADGPATDKAFNNYDGLSRAERLRYDSPSLAGFKISTSLVEEEQWDVALRYAGEFAGAKVKAGIAYADKGTYDPTSDDDTQFNGSVSVLLDMGVSATFAYGSLDYDDPAETRDPESYYFKLGYQTKALTEMGKTAFSIDWMSSEDIAAVNDEGDVWGLQVVQKVKNWGTEFYGAYRQFSLDRAGADFDDVSIFAAGMRIKF